MKKIYLFCLLFLAFSTSIFAQSDVIGFWKILDSKTGKPESIIGIYKYLDKYYGRIVATYDETGKLDETLNNPKSRAPGVKGNPFYAGLDIIWGLTPDAEGKKLVGGKVIDPEKGKIYNAKMWKENGNLIMRGEILFFGENQIWPAAQEADFPPDFKKPNLQDVVPVIPEAESPTKKVK
jgi:uncharacterized protein (DUF2147 family)